MTVRIIIIGPTLLTRTCLEALVRNGKDEIAAVYTLGDTLAWEKSRFTPMDDIANRYNIPLYKVKDINAPDVVDQIKSIQPDVIFELGWSQIISKNILDIPERGCIGVHASLLPKNRGAASLNWALIKGEKKTGVTLFYLAEKPDDGDIIAQKEFGIDDRDDINTLHLKSDLASAELLLENIGAIRNGTVKRIKQNADEVTYTPRRRPEDGTIDWNKPPWEIYNWVRAQTHPFPGAFTWWKNKKVYIWSLEISDKESKGAPGEIRNVMEKEGVLVNTKENTVLIKRAQLDGEIEMWADELAGKYSMKHGDLLG